MTIWIASSQAAMLALAATSGDECYRTDLADFANPDPGALFHLAGTDASVLSNWQRTETIGEKIVKKTVALLKTTFTGIASVWDQRIRPFEESELPAINVRPGREAVTYPTLVKRTSPVASHELHIKIRMENGGDPPSTDWMRGLVVRTLMADRSLGGLAIGIGEVESSWEDEAGSDATFGVLEMDFEVQYATAADDTTVQV